MKGWIRVTILCLVMGLLSGCGQETTQETPPPLVRTTVIGMTDAETEATFSGTVHGRVESALAFQIGGQITERLVQAGDRVTKGQPLYRLDSVDVSQQVAAAEEQLTAARLQLELAETNLRRFEELYAADAISAMTIDQARNGRDLAAAQVGQAEAAYNRALNQESFATLRSDSNGVVGMTLMEVGQVTGPGTPVVVVVDDSEKDVLISLTESNVRDVYIGQRAKITFWSRPGLEISGVVREVSATPIPQTGTYDAKIALAEMPEEIQLGMTARVRFTDSDENIILLPLSAIAEQSDTPAVWVVRDEKAYLQKVETGAYHGNNVEILSGLKKGDRVVTAGTQHLSEGEKVRV